MPDELLFEANKLRLEGRSRAALEKLKTLLSAVPGHVGGHLAMADLLKSEGQEDQSLAALRRAAEHAPTNAHVWRRYVFELRLAGRKSRARKAAGEARVVPEQRKALKEIAEGRMVPVDDIVQMINRGEVSLAWKTGMDRVQHFPGDHRLLNLLGVAALKDEDPVRAEPVLRRALEARPDFDAARGNLGLALLRQGRTDEAIRVLEPSKDKPDALPAIRVNLASAYQKIGRWREADALTADLLSAAPDDAEVLGIRCKTLIALGRASEAVQLLEPLADSRDFALHDVLAEALGETRGHEAGLDHLHGLPDQPRDAEVRLVSLLAEWGDLEGAAARSRRLAETHPTDPEPFRLIGLFSKWKPDDPLISRMQDGLTSESLAPLKRGAFGLALAKALMDAGEDDKAMKALHAGNGHLRSLYDYDVAADELLMQEIAEHWTAQSIGELGTALAEPAPVFIVGLPRSGSTLLETILSRHPDVESLGESPLAYAVASKARLSDEPARLAGVAAELAPALTPGPGKRVVTDKLLANFLNVGVLAACFPNARFVEMRRDYRATCLSIYQTDLGWAAHPYSMDLAELARYAVAYDRLMNHWSQVLGQRLVRVDYGALVAAPDTEIPRILSELNLDWHEDCLRPQDSARRINTMSVGQARQPISTGSLNRWKRFETGLSPLIGTLEDAGLL